MDNEKENKYLPIEENGEFFKNQLYQQTLESSSGWTILAQAIVGRAVNGEKAEESISVLKEMVEISKQMQMNTIKVMRSLQDVE